MTFENYYEIFKVRNPGKLNDIDKKILEDFWDKAQEEVDVSEYIDRIDELQTDLRDKWRKQVFSADIDEDEYVRYFIEML